MQTKGIRTVNVKIVVAHNSQYTIVINGQPAVISNSFSAMTKLMRAYSRRVEKDGNRIITVYDIRSNFTTLGD